jgi:hypothetical protein
MKKDTAAITDPDVANQIVGRDAYIFRLKAGETVVFGEPGNSMVPKIHHCQKCVYAPVRTEADIQKDDIVFCKVGPHHYTHIVKSISVEGGTAMYLIGNNHGRINGWTSFDNIYGKVTEVLPTDITKREIAALLLKLADKE